MVLNFIELRDAGDPVALAEFYYKKGADELVFLDITATIDRRKILQQLVRKVAQKKTIAKSTLATELQVSAS